MMIAENIEGVGGVGQGWATWATWPVWSVPSRCAERPRATWPSDDTAWRACHERLRATAQRRCELDAEELALLREAERLQIWRPLGMVSLLDYMDEAAAHVAHDASIQDWLRAALQRCPRPRA